jgi:hypothetical protein
MKHIITSIVCLAAGVGIGWYFGYTRPTLQAMHLTQELQKETGIPMEEMAKSVPDALASLQRQDETAARYSLGAYKILAQGDVESAKSRLLLAVGSYYRVYHDKGGDTNLLAAIAEAAQKYPAVAAEISRKD